MDTLNIPTTFEKLTINDLDVTDLTCIKAGMDTLYGGQGLHEVLRDMDRNALHLYRITDTNASGIIMFKLTVWPAGKELILYMMAGQNLLKSSTFNQIVEFARRTAREESCRWLSTETPIPTLAKLYTQRFGKPASTTFREEI